MLTELRATSSLCDRATNQAWSEDGERAEIHKPCVDSCRIHEGPNASVGDAEESLLG
jgi:hypothetical protein